MQDCFHQQYDGTTDGQGQSNQPLRKIPEVVVDITHMLHGNGIFDLNFMVNVGIDIPCMKRLGYTISRGFFFLVSPLPWSQGTLRSCWISHFHLSQQRYWWITYHSHMENATLGPPNLWTSKKWSMTRWWLQILFIFTPYLGKWSDLTIFFSSRVGSTTNKMMISNFGNS